jgi:hypothetical protein
MGSREFHEGRDDGLIGLGEPRPRCLSVFCPRTSARTTQDQPRAKRLEPCSVWLALARFGCCGDPECAHNPTLANPTKPPRRTAGSFPWLLRSRLRLMSRQQLATRSRGFRSEWSCRACRPVSAITGRDLCAPWRHVACFGPGTSGPPTLPGSLAERPDDWKSKSGCRQERGRDRVPRGYGAGHGLSCRDHAEGGRRHVPGVGHTRCARRPARGLGSVAGWLAHLPGAGVVAGPCCFVPRKKTTVLVSLRGSRISLLSRPSAVTNTVALRYTERRGNETHEMGRGT